jgi:citrate synthase
MNMAKLILDGHEHEFPVVVGSEGERGIDISSLRSGTAAVTLDPGYGNTGSCVSEITFIDGERGILRYRGYPIEQVAQQADFVEVAYLLIYGKLPNRRELDAFKQQLTYHSLLHEDMKKFFEGYPPTAHPMAILSSMVASLSAYYPSSETEQNVDLNIVRLIAKAKTIAAFSYKKTIGQPFMYPRNELDYCANFLHMMFAVPSEPYVVPAVMQEALNLLLILHADHEQNCSTSTVRMVGSSEANLFASIAAGICALWGPRHGGANQKVIEMLEKIRRDDSDFEKYVALAKDKDSNFRLMGFGHRVYKNFDPRAKILKATAAKVLAQLGVRTRCSTSPRSSRRWRCPTSSSSTRSSTPTSTSTAASSTGRWASPPTCSR